VDAPPAHRSTPGREQASLRFPRLITLLLALIAAAAVLAGCGGEDDGEGREPTDATTPTSRVTIYSSLPLQGPYRESGIAMVRGIRLALRQAGGRAGGVEVAYEPMDAATAHGDGWTPEAVSSNARRVVQDPEAVGYIGDFESEASAVSMPILNEGGVPQVSPGNTAVGLTTDGPGAAAGEPDQYYPTGTRHYVRLTPKDTVQGRVLANVMREDGCGTVALAHDGETYGRALAQSLQGALEDADLELAFSQGIDPRGSSFRPLAERARAADADCFVFSGVAANGAVQLFGDVARTLPDARLYGSHGLADQRFTDPDQGGIPPSVARRTKVTNVLLNPESYPPEGQEFFKQFEEEYGEREPDPWAIYGYEAARLLLDAIERAGSPDKEGVVQALFETRDRESVLGTYSIDDKGDTTLSDYGVYTIEDGDLIFDAVVGGGS
jgi:branched-chain amino acid transport system substrate-binding protein